MSEDDNKMNKILISKKEYVYLADMLDKQIEFDHENDCYEENIIDDITLDERRKLVLKLDYMANQTDKRDLHYLQFLRN